jgi:general secretion pathway protein D
MMAGRHRVGETVVALALAVEAMIGGAGRARAVEREDRAAGSNCVRLPPGKRIVKLNLKPETEVTDLVAWISSVTCKQFIVPDVPAARAKVTVVAPSLITVGEAYKLFLDALDSVGLTVYPSGAFLRIVETRNAKSSPVPVIGFDGR